MGTSVWQVNVLNLSATIYCLLHQLLNRFINIHRRGSTYSDVNINNIHAIINVINNNASNFTLFADVSVWVNPA